MTDGDNILGSVSWPSPVALSEEQLEHLRKRAWQEQRILIVSPYDKRLAFFDKTRLCEIGNRCYGGDMSDDHE